MRGALGSHDDGFLSVGLIPARAGSTTAHSPESLALWAHPRPCGEHLYGHGVGSFRGGSSPPVRGALAAVLNPVVLVGLIPARAGSTRLSAPQFGADRAHPRSRGEHSLRWIAWRGVSGSSPLARGAPLSPYPTPVPVGLIPARAGSTGLGYSEARKVGAHPRSRGEHRVILDSFVCLLGSSPLARGAPGQCKIRQIFKGLIPARAGSTSSRARQWRPERAHPRSRGEY